MSEVSKETERSMKEDTPEEKKVSDSDTSEVLPLGAILDKKTEELRSVIFKEMVQGGIPASLMDYMLTSILAEVRDLKAKEYSKRIIGKEE
ncbi:hypothetical protein [Blautia wexlerae]|jgi:hypothetical protein|uniref:hypothetical protein n=1 Tax=Blautia wexlerae TaxID=418240 RepID=UPI00156FCEBC|nr:hypothetical protein [Blautia wexlerae]UVY00986.1 MAG: hypothetical protein [Bacteriophage sp.]NSG65612.1 hypothetical protein [Blautia wexlerae]UVY47172.1 MAG: hypothetical protein [Bacteriophage sp.]UVY54140.1 MAG: hypothetical protein [Bacteriophage sp.]UWD61582.1 MAG: hypothetical protein [Bacteriophage sp.]